MAKGKVGRGYDAGGDTLTAGRRIQIERQLRIGGGISRNDGLLLLTHIDRLCQLLDEVVDEGHEWTEDEWSVFGDAAIPLVDGWTVRTRPTRSRVLT